MTDLSLTFLAVVVRVFRVIAAGIAPPADTAPPLPMRPGATAPDLNFAIRFGDQNELET